MFIDKSFVWFRSMWCFLSIGRDCYYILRKIILKKIQLTFTPNNKFNNLHLNLNTLAISQTLM